MQRFSSGKKTNANIQGSQNTNPVPKKIQEKGVLPIKIFDVILNLNRLVDFPIENLDMSEFVINKNLPTHELSQD